MNIFAIELASMYIAMCTIQRRAEKLLRGGLQQQRPKRLNKAEYYRQATVAMSTPRYKPKINDKLTNYQKLLQKAG